MMMAMTEKHQCEKQVWIKGSWGRFKLCANNATFLRDGKWYCGIHDPEKVKNRQEKRAAEWKAKWGVIEAIDRRKYAERHYCMNLTVEYMETHQAVIKNTVRPEDEPIKCDYLNCAHGLGQAGIGRCPGDWSDPDCPEFITEEDFLERG